MKLTFLAIIAFSLVLTVGCSGYRIAGDPWGLHSSDPQIGSGASVASGDVIRVTQVDGHVLEGTFLRREAGSVFLRSRGEPSEDFEVAEASIAAVEVYDSSPSSSKIVAAAAVSAFVFAAVRGNSGGVFSPHDSGAK